MMIRPVDFEKVTLLALLPNAAASLRPAWIALATAFMVPTPVKSTVAVLVTPPMVRRKRLEALFGSAQSFGSLVLGATDRYDSVPPKESSLTSWVVSRYAVVALLRRAA